MLEIEQKFWVDDVPRLIERIESLGAQTSGSAEQHADTYFNHPARDFAQTKEAFRVRRVDGLAMMTYKGPKLPGEVKARREIELQIGSVDDNDRTDAGAEFEDAIQLMGFRRVATVTKTRIVYRFPESDLTVTSDAVDGLGDLAEIECVVRNGDDVEAARTKIIECAGKLGLDRAESRSYLTLLLQTPREPT